ncbi:MAG: hypothetical protein WA874_20280 [Chryseosolibacter sp.]
MFKFSHPDALIMNNKWKNRFLYWTLATIPLLAIVMLSSLKILDSFFFFMFLLFYTFTYRPLLDIRRLLSLGVIEEKDAWRFFVPFAIDKIRYIKPLWLG